MEEKEFVRNFISQFEEGETAGISIKKRFRDIEDWSSLSALTIIAMVDEVYNVKLNGNDIIDSETIEDIYNIVKSRI